jgi:outer membrane protein assembly factor BamB
LRFAQTYADTVDGTIVAEPLVATVNIRVGPSQGTEPVVFVAKQADGLYAFNEETGQLLWNTNFHVPGQTALSLAAQDFEGTGIIGASVIDGAMNKMYLVSSESYGVGNVVQYIKTLHAIDMSDGVEEPGGPTVIADTGYVGNKAVSFVGPSVRGTGAESVRGRVPFDVSRQLQRPGLTLDGNTLVIGFGSAVGIVPYYHGWILTYNKTTLKPTGVFNDTPNGHDGGIWNDGNPIQVDSQGYQRTTSAPCIMPEQVMSSDRSPSATAC